MKKTLKKYNTLPRRVLARSVDFLLIGNVLLSVFYSIPMSVIAFKSVIVTIFFVYYIVMLKRNGQTVGMYVAGTKLVDIYNKSLPTLFQIILREIIGTYIVLIPILLLEKYAQGRGDEVRLFFYAQASWMIAQFLIVVISNRHRTLHDYIAQTGVIKVLPFGIVRKPFKYAVS